MDLPGLVESVELVDVRVIESVAQLRVDPAAGLRAWELVEFEPALALQAHPVSWGEEIETWFRLSLDTAQAVVSAAVSVRYRRDQAVEIPADVRQEFAERISVMTAVPYLRAEVQALAAKLRLGDLVLPLIRQSSFRFEDAPPVAPDAGGD